MLTVHRAEGTAVLARGLADLLRTPPADPFAREVVAVPAKGVERWLAQQLSVTLGAGPAGGGGPAGDGVCAAVEFPSPGRLVADALAAAQGIARADDPWAAPLWPLLEVLDDVLDEPWAAVLARHLGRRGDEVRRGRRYATASHLADLFAACSAARPQVLRAWAEGRDTDGTGPLPADLRWQAELWRRLRGRLGPSPAERLEAACADLRRSPELSDLPARLSLFGPTRLATDALAVLAALAEHRDVHLWLPHPSPALWEALRGRTAGRRADDTTATTAAHPLLRSLAREARELQVRLPPHTDVHHAGQERPSTLLGRLQADLRDDRPPQLGPWDDSICVHACHGPARQVEVLRELLLGLFQRDATLEPRDVLVLCPDVETYAPLVSAAFGLGPDLPHPGHGLRVRLADRSLRQTNPLLDTVARLLALAGSRVTASQVLDLAASAPVRRRFAWDDEDVERLRDWIARSGVRWGLDATRRAPYGLAQVPQNTWQAGLDRVLLGVTTAEDDPVWLGLALPLDDVDSSDIDLAGRLAELVDRLGEVLDRLSGERPAADWLAALLEGLDALTDVSREDAWQLEQARQELTEALEGATRPLRLPDVRAVLAGRLQGRPTRANFRTGSLTVCTLVPMRSVPHRVVVLLGMEDGQFPRTAGPDGDDVLARDPWVGERDVRAEDRQLLLDAVLAAQDRVVVLHTGADPVSGAERPPAVPVGELLDVLRAMTSSGPLVVRHPLQPCDERDFSPADPFSFDLTSLAGAQRARRPREVPPEPGLLPALSGPVALDDLLRFVEHPVRAFLRGRLGLTLPGEDDEVDDGLPLALDGLQEWAVGERMLRASLGGLDPATSRTQEWLRGTLPPGPLGHRLLDRVEERVHAVTAAAAPLLVGTAHTVDVRLEVGGRVLEGTVPDVRGQGVGAAVVTVGYSTLSPRHRLRGWLLALVLGCAGEGDRAVTVGRRGARARTSTLVAPADPRPALEQLLDLYALGMREPLPLFTKTSAEYARTRLSGGSVEQAVDSAEKEWTSEFGGEWEDRSLAHVWGDRRVLADLLTPAGAAGGEPTRFGELACALWAPVLAAEELS